MTSNVVARANSMPANFVKSGCIECSVAPHDRGRGACLRAPGGVKGQRPWKLWVLVFFNCFDGLPRLSPAHKSHCQRQKHAQESHRE